MKAFIEGMPKAELHVHLEGTLEPELIFSLAKRNGIELAYETPEAVTAAYDFHDLPSFLAIYYAAMDVLREEQGELESLVKENMEGALDLSVPLDIEYKVADNWLEAH